MPRDRNRPRKNPDLVKLLRAVATAGAEVTLATMLHEDADQLLGRMPEEYCTASRLQARVVDLLAARLDRAVGVQAEAEDALTRAYANRPSWAHAC